MKQYPTVRVPVSDLKPAPYNPRKIGDKQLAGLKRSMEEFGVVQPIVWNKRSGHVVSGHQRLKVLTDAGEVEADVVVVDLDDAREKALNIAQNSPTLAGEYTDGVADLLEGLQTELPEMFDDFDLGTLLDEHAVPNFEPVGEDEQSRLDEKSPTTCPECGHTWTR